jgi:hypothetical protein
VSALLLLRSLALCDGGVSLRDGERGELLLLLHERALHLRQGSQDIALRAAGEHRRELQSCGRGGLVSGARCGGLLAMLGDVCLLVHGGGGGRPGLAEDGGAGL